MRGYKIQLESGYPLYQWLSCAQRSRVRILVPPSLVAMSSRSIQPNDWNRDHVMVPIQYIDIVVSCKRSTIPMQ